MLADVLKTVLYQFLVFFGLVTIIYAPAQTETTSVIVPTDFYVYIPCLGETLRLAGELHALFHITLDGNGGFHAKMLYQPTQLKGSTDISGYEYVAVGVTQETFDGKVGEQYTFINNFYMIGKDNAPNFKVHEDLHVTICPDGTVTVDHYHFRVTCGL